LLYHRMRDVLFRELSFSSYLPFGNALQRVWLAYLEKGPPADGFVSDEWIERIIKLYRDDNTRLADEYHLPLKAYGYPLN
jgi:hypothetical protein